MAILKLEELTYPAVASLDRKTTLLLLSVSPLEEHGPHLPLGVDLFDAEYFAEQLARRFAEDRPAWTVVWLPPLAVGCGGFDAPGSVNVRASAVRDLIYDYGASFARHGFRYLFLSNGHGAATQLVALEEAARAVERRYGMKMVSLASSIIPEFLNGGFQDHIEKRLGRPLFSEEREMMRDDTHAGMLETSFMLQLRPETVGDYKNLPPHAPSWLKRLRPNHPMAKGLAGYVGYPAAADRALGQAALEAMVDVAYEKMTQAMENPGREPLSALARVPFLRTDVRRYAGLAAALGCAAYLGYWLASRRRRGV